MNYSTEIYLFCIYFSLNNFNYPNKKMAIPSKLQNSSAELPQHSREKKTLFGFEVSRGFLAPKAPYKLRMFDEKTDK